jgi:amidase
MRNRFLIGLLLAFALGLASCDRGAPYPVDDATLAQIADDLVAGKTTSAAVTQAYLGRIAAHDGAVKVMSDALAQAASADQRRHDGKRLSPLDGVPILLSANIDVAGMEDASDSEIARRLRAAGAVILGKTDIAGVATAVAARFAAAAVDTDTGGSLIAPAGVHGVVGLRPTVALTSRRGIVPLSLSLDIAGPTARTVRDAATALTVLAGRDPQDSATVEADKHRTNYVKLLSTPALLNMRVGVYRGSSGFGPQTQAAFDAALAVLEKEGARLVDIPDLALPNLNTERALIIAHEFKEEMEGRAADLYGQGLVNAAQKTPGRVAPAYWEALEHARRRAGAEGFAKIMADYEIIAVVAPTDMSNDADRPSLTGLAALAGYPLLSIPMGQADGRSVGLSFVGPPWSEDLLLAMGYVYEQARGGP